MFLETKRKNINKKNQIKRNLEKLIIAKNQKEVAKENLQSFSSSRIVRKCD